MLWLSVQIHTATHPRANRNAIAAGSPGAFTPMAMPALAGGSSSSAAGPAGSGDGMEAGKGKGKGKSKSKTKTKTKTSEQNEEEQPKIKTALQEAKQAI